MKAMLFDRFGAAPEVVVVPDPSPPPDGVVVQVMATGVCRSDWHAWKGHDPDVRLPHVPGHELAGTVVAAGSQVTGFRMGNRVTVPFILACGRCAECRAGAQQVCVDQFQPGFTHWGSFADYVAIPRADQNLVRLPESMGFDTAASLGCRFATAFRAVADQGRAAGGEWVAIHGAGGVGLSAVMIATALGARVIAIDVSQAALDVARALGAVATIDARTERSVPEAVQTITGGGAHLSMDAIGTMETCFQSIACLRRRGRHVQVGLMVGNEARAQVPMARIISHELEVLGSHGMQAWRYDTMLEMIAGDRLRPDLLIGETLSLADAIPVLTTMDTRSATGIAIVHPQLG